MKKSKKIVLAAVVCLVMVGAQAVHASYRVASTTLFRSQTSSDTPTLSDCTSRLEADGWNAAGQTDTSLAGKYSDRTVWVEIHSSGLFGKILNEQQCGIGSSVVVTYDLGSSYKGIFLRLNPNGAGTSGCYAEGILYD